MQNGMDESPGAFIQMPFCPVMRQRPSGSKQTQLIEPALHMS